ncbi:MAG: hypothetical protein ACLFPL_04110 [Candidatus Nanoarchaeia archaeon]
MTNFPYNSLTHLLHEVYKSKPTQLDQLLTIIGSYDDFKDTNEITEDEISSLYEMLGDSKNILSTGDEYEIGRRFFDKMQNTYMRVKGSSASLSNKKAKSLRRTEREVLEDLITRYRGQ